MADLQTYIGPDTPTYNVNFEKYGRHHTLRVNPALYKTPVLADELARTWQGVCSESPSLSLVLTTALTTFLKEIPNYIVSGTSLKTFRTKDLKLQHLTSWELAQREKQQLTQTNSRYGVVLDLFNLLRRYSEDNPGILHPELKNRLLYPTRLDYLPRPGLPDHTDEEVRRIRSAAHRVVHQARLSYDRDPKYVPTHDCLIALHILLSLATGEPPEVLRELKIDDIVLTPINSQDRSKAVISLIEQDGIQTFAVTYTKSRAHKSYQEVYDRSRQRAVFRTLSSLVLLTHHARTAYGISNLWVSNTTKGTPSQFGWHTQKNLLKRWYNTHVKGKEILPPHNFIRLRKVTLRREVLTNPTRYLRDGKRHTPRTLFEHYTNSEVLRAQAGSLLVTTMEDFFNKATGPTVVTPEAEILLRQGVTTRSIDSTTAHKLLNGELEGALTACRDPEASPHAPQGDVCPVAYQGHCFSCPNSIITKDHLPALLLIDKLSDPTRAGNSDIWQEVWRPIHEATSRILPLFPVSMLEGAKTQCSHVALDIGLRNDLREVHDV